MLRIWAIAWLFFFILAPPSFCAEPQYGGILRTALLANPRSLDPHMSWECETPVNTYNTLLRWNKDMSRHELDLAESLDQPDDLTYVFKLRKGVRFHNLPPVNGRELTSEDVKYSIERVLGMHGQKALFPHRIRFENRLSSISTPDNYTVIFRTKEPYAPFLSFLCPFTCTIVPREAVEKFGDLKNRILGTGPFMEKEYVPGSHISLVRNPHYFRKGLPYLDGIKVNIGLDQANLISNLVSGGLDLSWIYYFQVPDLKKKAPEVAIYRNRGQGRSSIQLRSSPWFEDRLPKPPMDKVEVRRAIALAIEKHRLVNLAMDGYATVQVGVVPANWAPYSLPEKEQTEYNPQKAKRLLTEAGYPDGIKIELLLSSNPDLVRIAQVLKEMLKDAGIHLELKVLEPAQAQNRYFKFDYHLAIIYIAPQDDPGLAITGGFARNAPTYRWNNKEIYDLVDLQNTMLDPQKRGAVLQAIQRKIMEEGAGISLLAMDNFWVFQPWVFLKDAHYSGYQRYFFEETWMAKR